MNTPHRVPFWLLIIMNINVIIGAGLFVNPAPLTRLGGVLGVLSYATVGLLILPIVLSVAATAQIYPATEGGLNFYIQSGLGKIWGLIGIGSYFFAKVVSSALLIKTSIFYLRSIFPSLVDYPAPLFMGVILVALFFLNMGGVQFGSKLQFIFMILKVFPIVLVIISAFWIFNGSHFQSGTWTISGFTSSLPIAMYGLIGFEMCCSIGHVVRGGARQLAKVVISSFMIVVVIATLFQLALFGGLGMNLAGLPAPMSNYFALVSQSFPGGLFVNVSILFSVLGASYGFLYANNWNAYVIAREMKHWSLGKFLMKKNTCGIPVLCLLVQIFIVAGFLFSGFNIVTLARLAVLGIALCYILVMISLLKSYKTYGSSIIIPRVVPVLGLFSCLYIVGTSLKDLF